MGSWRFAMPLLSTLAALVIIVHSAEEDKESEYIREFPPRVLDTGTPSYDQLWREADTEHMMQKSPQIWTDNTAEEPPKRRRPGRKRKRRPQASIAEDLGKQDRYTFPEELRRPYLEVKSNIEQTTEIPKQSRKKIESIPSRWTNDHLESGRPLQRRGQRKKRPSLESWPRLSEFSEYRREEAPFEVITEPSDQTGVGDIHNYDENLGEHFVQSNFENDGGFIKHKTLSTIETELGVPLHGTDNQFDLPVPDNEEDNVYYNRPHLQEDKSLSEFSFEVMTREQGPKVNEETKTERGKVRDKSHGDLNRYEKAQDNSFIDPVTLKDILKRSNGTSLSEILQQHHLSLSDLLNGKENVISILSSDDSFESNPGLSVTKDKDLPLSTPDTGTSSHIPKKCVTDLINVYDTTTQSNNVGKKVNYKNLNTDTDVVDTTTENNEDNNYSHKLEASRRFPPGIRRKLRMRPLVNTTYKGQLSRDLIALNARKYLHHRRNATKLKEWRNVIPLLMSVNTTENSQKKQETESTTVILMTEEIATAEQRMEIYQSTVAPDNTDDSGVRELENINAEVTTATITNYIVSELPINVTDRPTIAPILRHSVNISGIRHKNFNNRLNKKQLRQKKITTETPSDNVIKNLFGMSDLESSSVSEKKLEMDKEMFPALEDFMTTQDPNKTANRTRSTKISTARSPTTSKAPLMPSTTEETAKFEIEEIFKDTRTNERLSKILMERNMTLSELVEHRERGSSHVHLADIFHNASKEPNLTEPFLSKSIIEPISKETYPLRAILEANIHDGSVKTTTIEPNVETSYLSIPVVMNFGNNVNENAENMGIMSLFRNVTKSDLMDNDEPIMKDSEGRPYKTDIIAVYSGQLNNTREPVREGRELSEYIPDDVVSWNEIFSLMRKNYKNESKDVLLESFTEERSHPEAIKKITLEEDVDGDGLIVLEDLQHLKDFGSKIASDSDQKLEVNSLERSETTTPGILQNIPSQTKSVTVATASIAGLAMILFLLTYAAFRWKQQRVVDCKEHNLGDERIPTPVFENRNGHRNNSSMRSMSPMLASSNIYTLNTLDSRNGKDSQDYMWDTLRKPFQ